jgi:hypothetical protein
MIAGAIFPRRNEYESYFTSIDHCRSLLVHRGLAIRWFRYTATGGLSRAIASFIFPIAVSSVDIAAAYEMRTPLSSPNASPGTSATYNAIHNKHCKCSCMIVSHTDVLKIGLISYLCLL